jgi:hypothetical protein
MGTAYLKTHEYLTSADGVFVEIGSERGEGSTNYFAELARKMDTKLITVDVKNVPNQLSDVEYVTANGSHWAQHIFPDYSKKISCLYLDNFDYNWDVAQGGSQQMIDIVKNQQEEYLTRGVVMNNLNCQAEHLAQMLALVSYMADTSVVVCDDTHKINDCYVGKCGAVIPLLSLHGYEIVNEKDMGVILARSI